MSAALEPAALAAALAEAGARVIVRDWLSANHIVFAEHERGAAVVDTGYVAHAARTVALVESALQGSVLARIVNTHLHSDHCGGNAALSRRWPDATLLVPAGYRDRLEPWDDERLTYRLTGQRCDRFTPSGYLAAGTSIELGRRRWQIHPAPGHDPDAVMLLQPDTGVLISGDALWEHKLAIIFPELAGEDGFGPAHAALDTIERLAPRVVIPGHGQPFSDLAAALAASRQRLDAFAAAPQRHRRHAVRSLLMYHLLEVGTCERHELMRWMAATPIFRRTLQCQDDDGRALDLAEEVIAGLLADRLVVADGERLSLPPP